MEFNISNDAGNFCFAIRASKTRVVKDIISS